jgi:hypothetical protein
VHGLYSFDLCLKIFLPEIQPHSQLKIKKDPDTSRRVKRMDLGVGGLLFLTLFLPAKNFHQETLGQTAESQ